MNRDRSQSLYETKIILGTWSVFCGWVLFVCAGAYQTADATASSELGLETPVATVMGLPSWVFWGIAVPWVVATTTTIVFALRGMSQDDPTIQLTTHIPSPTAQPAGSEEDDDA